MVSSMALKSKRPIKPSILSAKEGGEDEIEFNDEDIDEVESESEDDRKLLSDDSEQESDEGSIHSSDDDLSKSTESKLLDNPAWADAMSKILKSNKPKRKKGIVLARAKKLNDKKVAVPTEEKLDFEIIKNEESEDVKTEPEIKKEIDVNVEKPDPVHSLTVAQKRLLKKVWQSKGRVKPSALDKDREKALSKIATGGVITLFNAVRQQQKTLAEKLSEANGVEVKRDKALKSINKKEFLDTLAERAKCENVDNPVKSESDSDNDFTPNQVQNNKTGKTWDVLRNNFMMGASMKDWDKEEEEQDDSKTKKKVKTINEKKTKKLPGGGKFSFSMDVDADYDDEDQSGDDDDDGSGSDDQRNDGESDGPDDDMEGSSDFSD